MKNCKLSTKIWLILALSWVCSVGVSSFLLYRLGAITVSYDQLIQRIITVNAASQDAARVIQVTFKKQVQEWKDVLLRGSDPESLKKYSDAFEKDRSQVQDLAASLRPKLDDPAVQAVLDQFIQAHRDMGTKYEAALKVFADGKGLDFKEADRMVKGQDRAPTDLIDKAVGLLKTRTEHEFSSQSSQVARERLMLAMAILLSIAMVGLLSFFVLRSVNSVLNELMHELSLASEQVAKASAEVCGASQSLAQGTSQQAAAIQETSASSEELSTMTHKNADDSRRSDELMGVVEHCVGEANRTLEQNVQSMAGIKASAEKVSKIIKVIDDIAFQTNIIALNAAVEAARAGEAGLSFSVVADEVRNLAQRCAQAAHDTTALIDDSIVRSREGAGKLDELAVSIRSITESSGTVKTLVQSVTYASQQQTTGIEQIARAMTQVEQAMQSNAASAEQSAAAGQQLNAQAHALQGVVDRLRVLVQGADA